MKVISGIFLTVSSVAVLCSCTPKDEFIQIRGYAQGGTYSIKCRCNPADAGDIKAGADSILAAIDNAVSGYNPSSELSRRNRGEAAVPNAILDALSGFCDSLYKASGGVLDTRAGALYDIWGFGFKDGSFPDSTAVDAALKDRSVQNLNAVAQGYSADVVAAYLRGRGIKDMLVDVGGEMFCSGESPSGKGWTIGIDAPIDGNNVPGRQMQGRFTLEKGNSYGVVTSGNYRKFYIRDGVKYSHTVDPRTGCPVQHTLLSATIIAPTSALADALATICMVLGPEEARSLIESRPDIEGCLISASGDSLATWSSFNLEN